MAIKGTEGMSDAEIVADVAKGGRFVYYMFCVSVLVMSFRRSSPVIYIRSGGSRVVPGLSWSLLTFVVGWWGIPWGPIFSIQSIVANMAGGKDVTSQIVRQPVGPPPVPTPPPLRTPPPIPR